MSKDSQPPKAIELTHEAMWDYPRGSQTSHLALLRVSVETPKVQVGPFHLGRSRRQELFIGKDPEQIKDALWQSGVSPRVHDSREITVEPSRGLRRRSFLINTTPPDSLPRVNNLSDEENLNETKNQARRKLRPWTRVAIKP